MADSIWFREDVSAKEWEDYALSIEQAIQRAEAEEDRQRAEARSVDDIPLHFGSLVRSYRRELDIARNQGQDWEYGLLDLEGNLVNAKIVNGNYGKVWRIEIADGRVKWVNVSVANSIAKQQKFYESKGYELVKVWWHFAEGKYGWFALKDRGVVKIEKLDRFAEEIEIREES